MIGSLHTARMSTRDLGKLGQREIGLGHAFEPAERAAAHVDRLEAGILGDPRHDRIERARRDDQLVAANEFTKTGQAFLLVVYLYVSNR